MTTAQIILDQIKSIDRMALWAWGAKNYVGGKTMLQFDCNGPKHKGKVQIHLTPADEYRIETWKIRGVNAKKLEVVDGIHAEDLVIVLDELIG